MKILLILQIILLSFIFQTPSCHQKEDDSMIKWKGMNDVNDIVFLYKKGVTYEQKEMFQNKVLSKERPDGRGQDNPDGVIDLMLGRVIGDYDGGTINFSKNATLEQREKLKKAIESSPIVYKVYENVVPNEIKGL